MEQEGRDVTLYKTGDRCPCCGQEIQNKSREWLRLFTRLCVALSLEKAIELEPQDVDIDTDLLKPPPDAGIYPPVNPKK